MGSRLGRYDVLETLVKSELTDLARAEGISASNKLDDERCNTSLPVVCECAP